MIESKAFQDTPNDELADLVFALGMLARDDYGEVAFGELLMQQSHLYRTGVWQEKTKQFFEELQEEEEIPDEELFSRIDFSKVRIQ